MSAALARAASAEQERDRLRAGIEALAQQVERLRYDLDHSYSQREWSALTARATSAEQERDRLRAGIEGLAGDPTAQDETGTWIDRKRVADLLAGSGEQAGACPSCGSVDHWRVDAMCRPAPVVHNHGTEDGPGLSCREERLSDGSLRGECIAPVVPDSPDVYETIRAFIEEEVGFDGGPGMDDQARRLTDRVLAVVGQGVTAGCDDREPHTDCEPHLTVWADGATAEQREAIYEAAMGAAFTAAEGMDGVDVGGVGTLSDNRAVVRSGEQEGE